jgi:sorting nexin-1/2
MNPGAYSSVLRRYSDFFWLFERLHMERAGAIVPPVPEKQPVGRFSPTFVEDRRVQLERFLRRVIVHPELADASCLETFLRADDMSFQSAKQTKGGMVMAASQANMMQAHAHHHLPHQSMSPTKKDGFKRWFAEAKTSMTGDLVRSPDDDIFDEIHRYIHGLDNQMRNVSHQATGLVRKGKEIANGLFEFGLAFNLLGQSEADSLGGALKKMGETADRLSVLSAEQAEKEMAQFEEPLQDYIKTIHAVKLALHRRHEKRLTYSTCLAEVQSKQSQLLKLRSQIGSEAKAYTVEMSLRRAQEACQAVQEDFAAVSQRVLREVDRFKREKAEDMRRTVLDYINLQVDYNKRMEQVWGTLIPQLEQVEVDAESSLPPSAAYVTGPPPTQPVHPPQQSPMPLMGQPPQPYMNTIPAPAGAPPVSPPYENGAPAPLSDPSMISVQYRD